MQSAEQEKAVAVLVAIYTRISIANKKRLDKIRRLKQC